MVKNKISKRVERFLKARPGREQKIPRQLIQRLRQVQKQPIIEQKKAKKPSITQVKDLHFGEPDKTGIKPKDVFFR